MTVKLTTGRQLPGEVVRVEQGERRRPGQGERIGEWTALPLQLDPPEVAAEVYAVGTPREEKYSTTITKGIVSAYRTEQRS